MLASPLYPSQPFREEHDAAQYRPTKDIEDFKKLLPPPVEFVEGSSTGTFAFGDGKYQPINAPSSSPKTPKTPSKSEVSSRQCRPPACDLNIIRENMSIPRFGMHPRRPSLLRHPKNHSTPKTLMSLGQAKPSWVLDCRIMETLASSTAHFNVFCIHLH